jgi:cobalt/nickel transport protein
VNRRTINILLVVGVVALVVVPLSTIRPIEGEEIFAGSDGQAESAIGAIRPDYEPWFAPFWEPPSGEIESLLFGLQAALGAGFLSYCLGYWRGRNVGRNPSSRSGVEG